MNIEIKALLEKYKKAVFDKDLESYLSLFDENIRIFDMWEKWSYDSIISWKEVTTEWFSSLKDERVVVEFNDIQEKVSGDLAVVTAFVTFTAINTKGESIRSLQERLTWVIEKKNLSWKIIHSHSSGPVNHQDLKIMLLRHI